jgi:hypothetical protein
VDDYGEDSDFVRIRVRGMFPRAGSVQFIPNDLVRNAMQRKALPDYKGYARILALDVARHGDDQSVFCRRQGRHTEPFLRFRIADTMQLAAKAAEINEEYKPDAFFVDATGMGWGVVDRLRQLNVKNVIAIQTGETAVNDAKYHNRAAELWGVGKEWLEEGGCLPFDPELEQDLTGREYGFDNLNRIQLEKKEDMKKRGLASPDNADALFLTFANPVQPKKDHRNEGWRERLKLMRKRHHRHTTGQLNERREQREDRRQGHREHPRPPELATVRVRAPAWPPRVLRRSPAVASASTWAAASSGTRT